MGGVPPFVPLFYLSKCIACVNTMVTRFSDFRRRELARWVIVLAQFSFSLVKVTVDLSSLEPFVDKHSLSDFLDSTISLPGAHPNSGLGRGVTHIVIAVEFDAVSSPSGLE